MMDASLKLKVVGYAEIHGNRAASREFTVPETKVRDWRRMKVILKNMNKTKKAQILNKKVGVVGGVSVLVRDGILYSEYTLNTTLQAKVVTISTSKTITVCSLYLPPSENLNIVLLTRLIDQLPTPFVICGDFNGHSMTWVVI